MTRMLSLAGIASLLLILVVACSAPHTNSSLAAASQSATAILAATPAPPTAKPPPTATPEPPTPVPPTATPLSPTPTSVPTATSTPVPPSPTPGLQAHRFYKIGEEAAIDPNLTLKVVSAKKGSNRVDIEVQLANGLGATGNVEVHAGDFEARDSAGHDLRELGVGPQVWLYGKIPPGSKFKGTVSYALRTPANGLKLYFTGNSSTWDALEPKDGALVFALDEVALSNPWPKPAGIENPKPFAKGTVYSVGDAVNIDGEIVKLVKGSLNRGRLTVSVLVYNGTARDMTIPYQAYTALDTEGAKGEEVMSENWAYHYGTLVSGDTSTDTIAYQFPASFRGEARFHYSVATTDDIVIFAIK